MKNIILLTPLFLASCAFSAASYKELAENNYEISASGNIWDTEETLLATINKKAKKICGSENYKLMGESSIVNGTLETGLTSAPTQTLVRKVVCDVAN